MVEPGCVSSRSHNNNKGVFTYRIMEIVLVCSGSKANITFSTMAGEVKTTSHIFFVPFYSYSDLAGGQCRTSR